MAEWTPTLFRISSYDNPETIRFRKYVTGTPLVLEGVSLETGLTPKRAVWTKGPAKLYRYEPEGEKSYPVPILLVYAHILKPYILDLVPGNSCVEHLLAEGFDVYLLDWGYRVPRIRACPSRTTSSTTSPKPWSACLSALPPRSTRCSGIAWVAR